MLLILNYQVFKKTEKIIKLCQLTNASHYIANNKSSNYLDENMFKRNKIELQYQNYEHPIYEQDNHDFYFAPIYNRYVDVPW